MIDMVTKIHIIFILFQFHVYNFLLYTHSREGLPAGKATEITGAVRRPTHFWSDYFFFRG